MLAIAVLYSCSSKDKDKLPEVYEGPILESTDVDLYYSDSAIVKIYMKTAKMLQYMNQDQEFPDGIYIEQWEKDGTVSSSLKANHCYYEKENNLWKVSGDVVVKGLQNDEQLNTEELYWAPDEKKLYTDKFVRIETDGEVLLGNGLEANQDFSSYVILEPKGTVTLESEDEEEIEKDTTEAK